jgi:hypothetical protein
MPIIATCPSCGGKLRVPAELAGRKVKCPQCKGTLTVSIAVEPGQPAAPKHDSRTIKSDTAMMPGESWRKGARRDRTRELPEEDEDTPSYPSEFVAPGIRYVTPSSGSRIAAGLGLASLLIGVLSLPLAWVPQVGQLGLAISGFGLFLGLVATVLALVRGGYGLSFSVGGLAVCSLALGLGVVQALGIRILMKGNQEQGLAEQLGKLELPVNNPPVEKAPDKPAAPAVEQLPLHDASKGPIAFGDVRIQVGWVVVSFVKYQDVLEQAQSPDKYLGIQIRIQNVSTVRKVEYGGWAALRLSLSSSATLTDDLGNTYKLKNFGLLCPIVGQIQEPTSIYPGQTVEDLLVFEKPVENVSSLRLELQGSTVGGIGKIQIQIPKSMIHR